MAMRPTEFGVAVCEALGIGVKNVQRLTFDLNPGDAVTMNIKVLPNISPETMAMIAEGIAAKTDLTINLSRSDRWTTQLYRPVEILNDETETE